MEVVESFNFDEMEQVLLRLNETSFGDQNVMSNISIQEYVTKINHDLHETEEKLVQDYLKQINEIFDLNNDIFETITTLTSLREVLQQFDTDLQQMNSEISNIQSKSKSLSTSLTNRKVL
jgi:predicted  nucleic acid-binding Zn-ribbon protein